MYSISELIDEIFLLPRGHLKEKDGKNEENQGVILLIYPCLSLEHGLCYRGTK